MPGPLHLAVPSSVVMTFLCPEDATAKEESTGEYWHSSSVDCSVKWTPVQASTNCCVHVGPSNVPPYPDSSHLSRSTDAQRLCESVFEEVLNHDGIADKINLEMNYIGT